MSLGSTPLGKTPSRTTLSGYYGATSNGLKQGQWRKSTSHSTIRVRAFLPRTFPLRSFLPGRVVLHFQSAYQSTCSETPGHGGTSFPELPFSPPWKPESSRYVFSRPKRPEILTSPSAQILLSGKTLPLVLPQKSLTFPLARRAPAVTMQNAYMNGTGP